MILTSNFVSVSSGSAASKVIAASPVVAEANVVELIGGSLFIRVTVRAHANPAATIALEHQC